MVAKKESETTDVEKISDSKPPLSPDEYLSLNNEPASQGMPKELAAEVKTQLVTIYAPGQGVDPKNFHKSKDEANAWHLKLPRGAGLGLPGRALRRMSPTEVTSGIKKEPSVLGEPFKPAWMDYTPHPKMATDSRVLMKRLNGRLVEPHYGVFGSDDRQVYYPSGYPWVCVGRVFVWNDFSKPDWSWYGSAVLIGGRVILTAGHVVPWGSSNWAMKFVPGYYDGASILGAGVSSWVSDSHGYNTGTVSAWDMAVCRLYTPLGNNYGYFGTKAYSSSWEGGNYWTLAGYPAAVAGGNRPSRQMWWPVLDDDSSGSADELEYQADATGGNSGGPVFGFWSGQPYAIATHSGGEKVSFIWTIEDNNIGAGGGALNSLVSWARSNWP